MNIACFFADGFEEIEAILPLDLLHRAGCNITKIGINDSVVNSARTVSIVMDTTLDEWHGAADCFILPGGIPGVDNLAESGQLKEIITENLENNKLIAAICAAPAGVLDAWGLLEGKTATCFPSLAEEFTGAEYSDEDVCIDGNIITSKGVGTSFPFAFAIIEYLFGTEKTDKIKKEIHYSY
ncbi:DJ-1/PfpI family protein [bacterium]|nr:DJ-1/PfpI family protein [bacterium]